MVLGERHENGMNVDEKSDGENAMDADEEMDGEDEGYAGNTTLTTPRAKITRMAVDSDADMEDASASEQENSFSFQTPRRHGRRMRSNLTVKRASSVATLNPRKNTQDARLKLHTTSPPTKR